MTQTTNERDALENILHNLMDNVRDSVESNFDYPMHEMLNQTADEIQAALSSQEQGQAVACEYCNGTGDVHRADGEWLGECDCVKPKQPLAVPSGWKLVPIEPTNEMVEAAWKGLVHTGDMTHMVTKAIKAALLAAQLHPKASRYE